MMTDRPALHCPGQVQPVAGETPWPAQSSHLAKTEGGYNVTISESQAPDTFR